MTSPSEEGGHGEGPLEGEPSRLHPAALAVWTWQGILPMAVVLLLAGLLPGAGLLVLAVLAAATLVRYGRFRWSVDPTAVVIHQGVLVRRRRVIPRERIQAVDLRKGIAHRLFRVVEVRIEAVGGTETQGRLDAVAPEVAEGLRTVLLSPREDRPATQSDVPEEAVRARMGLGSLVLAGVTGGRVGVMAALLGFVFQFAPDDWLAEVLGRAVEEAPDPASPAGLRLIALLALAGVGAAFLLSVAASVAAHWRFTLSRRGDDLAVRRGLFTQHVDTVPLRRIQAVRIEENAVRRLLGVGSVRAVVAGRAGAEADPGMGLLLPLGSRERIHRIAREAVGAAGEGPPDLEPMPLRARRRRMARAVAVAALAALAGAVLTPPGLLSPWAAAGVAALLVLPPGLALARGAYSGLAWTDLGTHVGVREGVLTRRTTLVPVDRLQAAETTESPFQRWNDLATLHLRVAQPLREPTPRALDLDRAHAERWREELIRRSRPRPRRPRSEGPPP